MCDTIVCIRRRTPHTLRHQDISRHLLGCIVKQSTAALWQVDHECYLYCYVRCFILRCSLKGVTLRTTLGQHLQGCSNMCNAISLSPKHSSSQSYKRVLVDCPLTTIYSTLTSLKRFQQLRFPFHISNPTVRFVNTRRASPITLKSMLIEHSIDT